MKSIPLVALVALIFGGVAGGVVGSRMHSTTVIRQEVASSNTTLPTSDTSNAPLSWAQVASAAGPAVVTIINQGAPQRDIFGNTVPGATGEGSGFAIDHNGDIVTNNHVVEGAATLSVVFADGHKAPAHLIRADPLSDLALIKVNVPVQHVLQFGNSNALRPGDPVLAIGSALGEYRNTVTAGIISASGRTIQEPSGVTLHNMLQTDAAINQGNSGGPLLNDRGQVIGVDTAITRGQSSTDIFGLGSGSSVVAEGLGFAIPSSIVSNVAGRLRLNKPPAFFGVSYEPVTQQLSTLFGVPQGAYVRQVRAGSPAASAGIKVRDVIESIGGTSLTGANQLEYVISEHSPGDRVKMKIWRQGKTMTITVKLGAKPSTLK